jgi:hypothetical protein
VQSDIEGLHEGVVPVCVLAVHASRGRSIGAVGSTANPVEEVRLLSRCVEVELGPLTRRHSDSLYLHDGCVDERWGE